MSQQRENRFWFVVSLGVVITAGGAACGDRSLVDGEASQGDSPETSWAALMDDGDVSIIAPGAATRPPPPPPPDRSCFGDECARVPLALWTLDDCNTNSTELFDSAFTSPVRHPAFRSVSAACVEGRDGQGVRLAGGEDIVYAPDQPDFNFDHGLTIAAWTNPDRVTGTQSIARKRLDNSSAVVLAIDGRRLNFVLRLTNGRLVGVSTPVAAKRFTHVAATYDGKEAILYLDGTVAARARAKGTIAPGAGPLFFGNDASGRAFKGVLDTLYLNTLAAPPDVVATLTCVRRAPIATFSPSTTPPTPGGTTVPFDLAITNANDASCPAASYQLFASLVPPGWFTEPGFGFITVATGETAHLAINVTSESFADAGTYSFQYIVADASNFSLQTFAEASYVVTAPPPPTKTGCAATPPVAVAPGGYYVNGNTICTADGRAHMFHGVDRPSLEWQSGGVNLSLADFRLIASWNANVVRIGLNQDFWISDSPLGDPNYPLLVDDVIRWAEIAGMDVILDLHWSDRGVLGSCLPANGMGCQQLAPDVNSLRFWSEVAARYRDDGRVMFELYNEPHDISWEVWRNGGDTGQGWQAVGMQQLADAVRAAGANNIVIIGGLNWAYDLSGVPANRILGNNIVYASHPYKSGDPSREPPFWQTSFGFLAATDPVVITEFGDITGTCATDYPAQVIRFADVRGIGWTAWAWFPGGCHFPALIDDWAGTPSPLGAIVKPALLGYDDPPASPPGSGGARATDVSYLFDLSNEGWAFNLYDAPDIANLAVHPPLGHPPSLLFDGADGEPGSGPGALKLTATFTGLDQYVAASTGLGPPGINPSAKTLHAMVRLVSGALPEGGVQLYASSGMFFAFLGSFHGAGEFPLGEWVPLTLDLTSGTADFNPNDIVEIGLQFFSGVSSGGDTFTGSGEVVFEIDTVTD
jgi:endoglucanase